MTFIQVPTSGQNNFSFFNRKAPIQSTEELLQYLEALQRTRQDIADGNVVYDPTKTYITFVVGDGDNTGMDKKIHYSQFNLLSLVTLAS